MLKLALASLTSCYASYSLSLLCMACQLVAPRSLSSYLCALLVTRGKHEIKSSIKWLIRIVYKGSEKNMTRLSSPYVWVGHESFLASLTRCLVTSKLVPPRDIPFHFFFREVHFQDQPVTIKKKEIFLVGCRRSAVRAMWGRQPWK